MKQKHIICILIAFVCTMLFTCLLPRNELQSVSKTYFLSERLYGVDEKYGDIRVFACDANGTNAFITTILKQTEQTQFQVNDFFMEEAGVYQIELLVSDGDTGIMNERLLLVYDSNKKEITYQETLPLAPLSDVYLQHTIHTDVWCVDRTGNVLKNDTLIFENNGSQIVANNTAYTFGNQALYFYNVMQQKCFLIPYDTGVLQIADEPPFDKKLRSYGYIVQLQQMKENIFTASFRQTDSKVLPMVLGRQSEPLERLYVPYSHSVIFFMLCTLCIYIVVKLYIAIQYYFLYTFPTILRIFCLTACILFVAGLFFRHQMLQLEQQQIQRRMVTQLFYQSQTILSQTNVKDWLPLSWKDTESYVSAIWQKQTSHDTLVWNDNITLYQYQKGNFYKVRMNGLYTIPMQYDFSKQEQQALLYCVEQQNVVLLLGEQSSNGNNIELYMPIYNHETAIIGILGNAYPLYMVEELSKQQQTTLVPFVMAYMSGIFLLMVLLIHWFLYPLQYLHYRPYDREEQIEHHTHRNEVSEILFLYRNMFHSTQQHLKHLKQLKACYEPFVPQQFVQLFGKTDIRHLSVGDQTTHKGTLLLVCTEQYSELEHYFYELTVATERYQGILLRTIDKGAWIFFAGLSAAIEAASHIQKSIDIPHSSIALVSGEVTFALIGSEIRMEIDIFSQHKQIILQLQSLCHKYQGGILVNADTLQELPELYESPYIRTWGTIDGCHVYEIFATQSQEISRLKAMTKPVFEQGILYYEQQKYIEARDCFMKVLKQHKDDGICNQYFSWCMYIQQKNKL